MFKYAQVWSERDGALFQAAKLRLGYGSSTTPYRGVGDTSVAGGAFLWEANGCAHNADFVHAPFLFRFFAPRTNGMGLTRH